MKSERKKLSRLTEALEALAAERICELSAAHKLAKTLSGMRDVRTAVQGVIEYTVPSLSAPPNTVVPNNVPLTSVRPA
jgi:hypothetical protein